jgi:hypothetical protein
VFLLFRNEISPSTGSGLAMKQTAALMLGILGLGAIFVQMNEIMSL